mmetsp:Transcript_3658/g.10420  ORF Transcript_3658/g.10420 Transcript_3658/m.10420 type:complete len:100 (-) Transcript_3658:26-325(-)
MLCSSQVRRQSAGLHLGEDHGQRGQTNSLNALLANSSSLVAKKGRGGDQLSQGQATIADRNFRRVSSRKSLRGFIAPTFQSRDALWRIVSLRRSVFNAA